MIRRTRHHIRLPCQSPRGAVAVEMAITLLFVFIPAIIGIIEFGRAVMVQQVLVNAAREGARYAIVPGPTSDEVMTHVKNYLAAAGLGTGDDRKVAIWDDAGNDLELADAAPHATIQVVVQVPYSEVGVAISGFFKNAELRARVQMRKE